MALFINISRRKGNEISFNPTERKSQKKWVLLVFIATFYIFFSAWSRLSYLFGDDSQYKWPMKLLRFWVQCMCLETLTFNVIRTHVSVARHVDRCQRPQHPSPKKTPCTNYARKIIHTIVYSLQCFTIV